MKVKIWIWELYINILVYENNIHLPSNEGQFAVLSLQVMHLSYLYQLFEFLVLHFPMLKLFCSYSQMVFECNFILTRQFYNEIEGSSKRLTLTYPIKSRNFSFFHFISFFCISSSFMTISATTYQIMFRHLCMII